MFEAEVELLREVGISLQTVQKHLPQNGNHLFDVFFRTRSAKLPQPGHQIAIEPGLDVERTFRIKHPPEALPDHTRLGKRHTVTGHDQTRVAVRATRTHVTLVDKCNRVPEFRELVSGANPNHAGANN